MPRGIGRAFDLVKIFLNLKEQYLPGNQYFALGIFQFQNRKIIRTDKQREAF